MSLRRTPTHSLPAMALTLWLALAATAAADKVTLLPDAPGKDRSHIGKVTAESPTEVTIGTQKVPVEQIESITYEVKAASSITTAVQREKDGKLAEAAADYKAAVDASESGSFVAQAAAFARLRILAQLKPAEAITGLDAFTRDPANKAGRHIVPALDLLIRLAMAKADYDRADRAVAILEKVPTPTAPDRAAVARARILTKRGKPADAAAMLDKLIAGAKADTPKGREVRLAKAEALAADKKYDDARKLAMEAIDAASTEDADALSTGYNTLGDILRAAGKPKDALLAYLHTDLLFAKDRDEHARALAQIASLWRELKREDRADETLERLKHDYPASPWLASTGGGK